MLAHAFNTTFTAVGPDGRRSVLHIVRSDDEAMPLDSRRKRVESELWWLDRLRAEFDATVPIVIRTPDGSSTVVVEVAGMAAPRLATMFGWVDGRFRCGSLSPADFFEVGRLTARLHNHTTSLKLPPGFVRPVVDEVPAAIEERWVRLIADRVSPPATELIRRAVARLRDAQARLGAGPDVFGLIHADIHQRNYLFRAGEVRLIDFGDCGWGHHLYDFAVTLNEVNHLPEAAELRAALLAGYRQTRDLLLEHEALIDDFIMLRQIQDLTSFVQEGENPLYARFVAQVDSRVRTLERYLQGS